MDDAKAFHLSQTDVIYFRRKSKPGGSSWSDLNSQMIPPRTLNLKLVT